jgi:hypothetical protein
VFVKGACLIHQDTRNCMHEDGPVLGAFFDVPASVG